MIDARSRRPRQPASQKVQRAIRIMPELPEVEAARRLLATHCQGGKITSIVLSEPFDTIVFSDADVTADTVSAALVGKRMVAVHRKGKQLWLELSSPPHLLYHSLNA